MVGDGVVSCPSQFFASRLAAAGCDVYSYIYDYRPTYSPYAMQTVVGHLDDGRAVFGIPFQDPRATQKEKEHAVDMIQLVSNFARTG